jgi:hypothetical protein
MLYITIMRQSLEEFFMFYILGKETRLLNTILLVDWDLYFLTSTNSVQGYLGYFRCGIRISYPFSTAVKQKFLMDLP